jgi:serine protease AprX
LPEELFLSTITINGVTVDPLTQAPALAAARMHSADATASNYVLLQTKAPLTKPQKEQLATFGCVVLEYVPDDTYLCAYPPVDMNALRALPFVQWANVYMRPFKINPSLTALPAAKTGPRTLMEMAGTQTRGTERKTVDVVFHNDVQAAALTQKVADAAGLDVSSLQATGRKVRITVEARKLEQIANLDEVRHIEEVRPYKLSNDVARKILRVESNPAGALPVAGEGQIIAITDTGFDRGSTSNVHPAFAGRVLKLYSLGRPGNASDPDGHGTHVAGSVLGDGVSAPLGINIKGTAPKAQLVLQSVLDGSGGLGGLPNDLNELLQVPYAQDKARIHTNSWGSVVGDGTYNENARELDNFVWKHRDCVVLFSAGNEGRDGNANGVVDPRSVTPPGTAKNCITIGASENARKDINEAYGAWWPSDFPVAPLKGDLMADDPEGMVAFSSRGPTVDQRIKPDLVAPGTFILSTRSRATTDEGWKLSADPLYFYLGGTSMATPLAAGCAALAREWLIKSRNIANPSAALVKALMINGAKNIEGQYTPSESSRIPNNSEGFGRIDMAAALNVGVSLVTQDEAAALETGESSDLKVVVPASASLLKITLVWTDPPGEGLQNDLDLIVRAASGKERHGNGSASSQAFDRTNNVEQVVWNNPPAGAFTVTVRAHRTVTDPQPYALVVRVN